MIPPGLLSPAAELYATLFPPAGPPIPGGNLYDTTRSLLSQDSYSGRIDESFGAHDSVFGRISYYHEPSSSSAGYPGALSEISLYGWNASVHESHVFGPDTLLDVHFGRNLGNDTVAPAFPHAPAKLPDALIDDGFSPNFISGFTAFSGSVIPIIAIAGYASTNGYNSQTEQLANIYELGGRFHQGCEPSHPQGGIWLYVGEFCGSGLCCRGELQRLSNLGPRESRGGKRTGNR